MAQVTPHAPLDRLPPALAAFQLDLIEQALEGSGVGLWDWDIPTGRSRSSRMNNRILGYQDSEDLGQTFDELTAHIHPDDARQMRAEVARYLRGEIAGYCTEFRVLRKDGSYAWLESRGVVVERGPAGEPLRMVGIQIDITDRKVNEQLRRDLEKALRRNQDELEELVRAQTRKLVEKADEAERGNRAKNVLLERLGQELRAPLEVLTDGCARLLEAMTGELPPQLRDEVQRVNRSVQQLSESVTRIFDVSSIESGTLEICATPVNLRRVLQEQCEAMQPLAGERGLDLRGVCCEEELVVFADRARLAQVVRELLSNALRFTDRGYVQVRARALEGAVLVEVQDTGPGIATERQATLFHAFRPVAERHPQLRQGLGLGLSISRTLIDAMAGTMGVASKPGQGSRFWFTLPLAASAQKVSSTRH
jgi:two-component system sensor histidine kinase/response regulator